MSKVLIKDEDGVAEVIASTGEKKRMHAVDAMDRVHSGTHLAEYGEIQIGDRKENILVAIKKKSAADLKAEKKADEKAMAKLQKKMEADEKKIAEKENAAAKKTAAAKAPTARTARK